jgi:serine/threonine protein kinase
MSTDKILGDRYKVGAVIGHGAFSVVHECRDMETNNRYAVKVMNKAKVKETDMEEAFEREVMALRSLSHCQYVTRAIEVLQSTRNFYVVMELADKGSLLQLIVKTNGGHGLQAHAVRKYFTQLMRGIRDMHACDIVHRDIKPENLLLDEWRNLKISDFGFAARATSGRYLKRQCGTPQYVAPEVLRGDGYIGQLVDIWSAGVTLYVFLCGQLPFAASDHDRLYELILEGKYPQPRRPEGLTDIPPAALHLLRCCLCVDPQKRWCADRILRHPYLAGEDDLVVAVDDGLGASFDPSVLDANRSPTDVIRQHSSCPNLLDIPRLGIDIHSDPQLGRKRIGLLRKLYESCDVMDTTMPDDSQDLRREGLGKRGALRLIRQASVVDLSVNGATLLPPVMTSITPPGSTDTTRRSTGITTESPRGRFPSLSNGSRPSTTPHDPSRFTKPIQRRFGFVHIVLCLNFILVCFVVLIVALLKIMFDIRLNKLPLPRSVRAMVESLVDGAGFGVPAPASAAASDKSASASPRADDPLHQKRE